MKRIEKNHHKDDEELEDDEENHPSSEPEPAPSVFVDEDIINTREDDIKPTTELNEKNVSKKKKKMSKRKKRRKKPPSSKNCPREEKDEEEIHDDDTTNVSPGAVLDGGHSSFISRKRNRRRRRKKKDKIITLKEERQGHSPMEGDKRATKRTRHRMESEEEGGSIGESDSEDSMDQPGASAIPGVGRHVMGHPSTTDGTVMYSMGGGSNHSNLENVPEDEAGDNVQASTGIYDGESNEEHLVEAELAPDIEIVEGMPMEEGEEEDSNNRSQHHPILQYRRHHLQLLHHMRLPRHLQV